MKTYWLIHGYSAPPEGMEEHRGRFADYTGRSLRMVDLRRLVLRAKVEGLEPFEDGLYRGWIHPFGVFDLLNDSTFNGLIDIIKHSPSSDTNYDCITLSGVKFYETTNIDSTVLFGANSDPLDVERIYLEKEVA